MAAQRSPHPADRIVGSSPAITALRDQIRHLAAFDTIGNPHVPTVVLQGETGTGKGLVARVIHESGGRVSGPFIDVNCAAIPEHLLEAELYGFEAGAFTDARRAKPGLFEAATRGTLFLDEIDALPLALQGKLLRSIEDKRVRRLGAVTEQAVDVKFIAAAQRPLGERVVEGRFRSDLYHRLTVVVLEIPPLRGRGDDILLLARHFVGQYAEAHGVAPKRLSSAAESWLATYEWPGNVRELSHLMERVTLLVPEQTLDATTLERLCLAPPRPPARHEPQPASAGRERGDEEARIRDAIGRTGGNILQAARRLGLSRNALRYRMLRYGIQGRGMSRVSSSEEDPVASRPIDPAPPIAGPAPEELPASIWERKPVAVLAIDLTFPKALGLDPSLGEPWTMAKRWEDILAEKVEGFGGVLLQRSPSLYTVVFGVPRALDRMPQRAVHAALAIRHLLDEPTTPFDAEARPEIRLGVHLGDVLVDVRGLFAPGQLLGVGDTMALPVRLLGLAAAGETVVSASVQRAVTRGFSLEPRSLPADWGSASPGPAYAVTGLGAARDRRFFSRFVGRQRELAELGRALDSTRLGRGQIVAIVGEAGVGKSRLCDEFIQAAREECLVLETVSPAGQPQAFLPLIELLKRYCGIDARDDERTRRQKVADRIHALDERLEDTVPYLLAFLGLTDPASALAQMDPDPRRRRTFDAFKALVLRESLGRPVILVVEDLHWLDSETLSFIDALVDSVPEARLLLLVTYRPEHGHRWGGKTYYTQLRLDPLEPHEAEQMVAALVGDASELKELVLSQAQGNPFFIEEIVQALLDRSPTAVELPPTIQGVLAARMDRLAGDERMLLQILAVLGHEFSIGLVQRVAGGAEDEVRALLARLQAAEFIHERPALRDTTYTFKHALTRDVAYNSLSLEQRRRLHGRTAEALEALFVDRLTDHYHALAHHCHLAGLTAKAVEYLGQAGRQAVQRSAYAEAIGHFRTALGLLSTLPAGRERSQQELMLQTALGAALMATRGMGAPEVEEVFTRARALCHEVGESPQLFQVLQGLSVFYALRVKLRTSEELADERRRLAERLGNPALILQAQIARGHILLALGELPSARVELERAAAIYDPRQHHALAFGGVDPSGRDHAAIVLWLLGYPDRALASLHQMLAIAREQPHPFTLTVAQLFAAMLHQLRREATPTRDCAEAATALATRHAFAMWRAMGLALSGWAVAAHGDVGEGVGRLRQGIDDWRATGAELVRPYFLGLLADAQASAGQVDDGLTMLGEALEIVDRTEQRWCEGELLRLRGELLLKSAGVGPSRVVEAEASLNAALDVARRQEAKSLELRAAMSLSRLWGLRGQRQGARKLLADVHGWFTEGFDTADLQDARVLLDELATR